MAFKFKTHYFCYNSFGYYYITNNYNSAVKNAIQYATDNKTIVYILSTYTGYIDAYVYSYITDRAEFRVINSINHNLEIL